MRFSTKPQKFLARVPPAEIFWVLIPLTLFDNMINSHSKKIKRTTYQKGKRIWLRTDTEKQRAACRET